MMDNALKFRVAVLSEFPRLISMWQDCFKDSQDAAENIFAHLQEPENIFVLAGENGPAAMLSVREFSLTSPMKLCKAAYIYGVATSPAEQGKGYSTALLNGIDALLAHRKYACSVLVPAEESLFGFYEKRGYEKVFNINKAELTPEDLKSGAVAPLEKIDAPKLGFIRDARFGSSKMFACWDEEYLEYVVMESEFYGGGVYAANIGDKQICAVCHKSGDTVFVKELGATLHTLEAALRSIHGHFGAEKYVLYLREDVKTSYTNNLLPFAMIKWYDKEIKAEISVCDGAPAYIAHVLD